MAVATRSGMYRDGALLAAVIGVVAVLVSRWEPPLAGLLGVVAAGLGLVVAVSTCTALQRIVMVAAAAVGIGSAAVVLAFC